MGSGVLEINSRTFRKNLGMEVSSESTYRFAEAVPFSTTVHHGLLIILHRSHIAILSTPEAGL